MVWVYILTNCSLFNVCTILFLSRILSVMLIKDKPVIRYAIGKRMYRVLANILQMVMLGTSETTGVKQNKDDHYFRITHTIGLVTMFAFFSFSQIFFLLRCKFLTKTIFRTIISVTLSSMNIVIIV